MSAAPANMLKIASILQCPVSGSDLSFIDAESLEELKTQLQRGQLRNQAGGPVQVQLEAALSSADGQFIYPVIDGILVLLPSLAIISTGAAPHLPLDTAGVMQFYDEIGWKIGKDGTFHDTDRFEDLRAISRNYVHGSYMRVKSHIPRRGKYLLDVASGPVQYPEYLTYSESYEKRICVDVSIVALRAAKARLGDKGIYIQGDITRLPLKDASVDGFVSLHTIYHVPAEKQATAFTELERVLKSDGTGVVIYSWGTRSVAMNVLMKWVRPVYVAKWLLKKTLPATVVNQLKKISSPRTPTRTVEQPSASSTINNKREFYFHAHDYAWFQREVASRPGWDLRVWRAVDVAFLRQYVRPGVTGRWVLAMLLYIENAFPRLCGRFGQYPMMVYTKEPFEQALTNRKLSDR